MCRVNVSAQIPSVHKADKGLNITCNIALVLYVLLDQHAGWH